MPKTPNVAVMSVLEDRYGLDRNALAQFLGDGVARLATTEFDGREVWFLDDTDKWWVRWYRELRGVPQGALAKSVGYSQTAVCNWENAAHPSVPPIGVIQRLREIVDGLAEHEADAA